MPSILNATTTNGLVTSADNSGSLQLQTNNGTTAVTIDTSQNVGIGTTSPSDVLTLNKAGSSNVFQRITNGANTSGMYVGLDSLGQANIYQAGNLPTLFFTNSAERMRIDNIGNMGFGVTAGTLTSPTNGAGFVRVDTRGTYWINATTTGDAWDHYSFRNNNGAVGSIRTTGTSTSFLTSSDYRLKENIAPMTGALAKVAQLKPVTYTWKTDGSAGQGFIAHELQAVVPDCVSGDKDAVETYTDEEGNEQTRPVYQGVDTSFLVATLTAAIQEQQAQIEELKAKVSALEGAK